MPELRERILYPRAGWLSLGLLVVMALALAWSVQEAGWLEQIDFLAPLAVWAVVVGALVGLLRTTIVITLPLGALLGAAVAIWMIGGEYYPLLDQGGRLDSLRADLIGWTAIVLDTGYPPQMSPYALGLSALMWGTAFTASYVVYRYHRVLDAILLLGAMLITNLSATLTNLFGHLLLFVIAALLLWLRASLVNRQDGWQRRRVNENLEVPAAILRSGIVFAGMSVALAWILTGVAVAAPLTGAWRSMDGVWTGVRDQFEGVFGGLTNPQSRISGSSFGPAFTVRGEWVSNDDEVLTLAAPRPLYLRTAAYDLYTGLGWKRSEGTTRQVAAGDMLFAGDTSERPRVAAAVEVEDIAIQMHQAVGRNIFTAGSPLRIYAPVIIHEPDGQPLLGGIEAPQALGAGETYELVVAISRATEAQLRVAGSEYPAEVTDLYLDASLATDRVRALAAEITEGLDSPYDQAKALAQYLRGSTFTYSTVGPEVPRDADLVDTFLFGDGARSGYCQYYASAMVLMARSLGIPARLAVGFAPGSPAGDDLTLVREANAHAWAEIYFPGYGWEVFESTKSINAAFTRTAGDQSTALPPQLQGGDPRLDEEVDLGGLGERGIDAIPSARPVPGAIDPSNPQAAPIDGEGSPRAGNALVMLLLVVAAGAFIWYQMRRSQRRWRLLPAGDRAWNQLTAAAGRAGIGPRPAETIYEYAGWLEDQLPRHIEPIREVADGKVWQAYSGRRMNHAASSRLDAAWARLRMPLVGLAFRRRLRSLVRRSGD